MDVVEVEDLEDEDLLRSTATLTSLSRQDVLDFYEGAVDEGSEEWGALVGGLGPGEMKVEGLMNVAIALEVEGHDGVGEVMVGGEVELETDKEGGVKMAVSVEVMGGKKGVVKAVEVLGQGVIELGGQDGQVKAIEMGGEGGADGKADDKPVEGEQTAEGKLVEDTADGKRGKEGGEVAEPQDGKKGEELETVVEEAEDDVVKKEGKAGEEGTGDTVDRIPKPKAPPPKSTPKSLHTTDSSSSESTWQSSTTSSEEATRPSQDTAQSPIEVAPPPEGGEPGGLTAPKPDSSHTGTLLERRLVTGKSREESLQRMREVCGMSERPVLPSGPGAIWDHETLNRSQFVQLLELFMGRKPEQDLVEAIADYIKLNYTEYDKVRTLKIPWKSKYPPKV